MSGSKKLRLKFWGVRGSIPTPQAAYLGFGGNTACIEIRRGDQAVVFDGGTGLRALGLAQTEAGEAAFSIFFTHFHWDHIQGLPFYPPLYRSDSKIVFHSSHPAGVLRRILEDQMKGPYFPVEMPAALAEQSYRQIGPEGLQLDGLTIRPFPLHHPGGATGYRVDAPEGAIVYASDYEHGHAELDRVLLEYARGADLLICDAQFTPEEYEARKGWGHSTWLQAACLARRAGVKKLLLFHHDPQHDDAAIRQMTALAAEVFENTAGAQENWSAVLE
jgi:phosphoribosyl 1,2-cyclic phosphodiesterase